MKQSLHEKIRTDFEQRIFSGELSPGERLPIEHDLMMHYGCSRMTVNKALSALAASGLIERRKRGGTFVGRPRVHSMVLDIPDLAAIVRGKGQEYHFGMIAREVRKPRKQAAYEVELAGTGKLLQLDGLHFANGKPLAIEFRLVSISAVPDLIDADLGDHSPGSWLLEHIPWTEAETRICATVAKGETARLLETDDGYACLCVERSTWRTDQQVTYVKQLFLGDAYELVARFSPGAPVIPESSKG